jgi:chromate reductase, NAD(P)H dehydrogenase (quinone)
MALTPKILAFAGSTRLHSYNKLLVKVAAQAAQAAGAEVTVADLRDFPMPLFDEDLEAEEGMPAQAQAFKQLLIAHQGFLIASPEYNSSFSAVLKNAVDWASRPAPGEPPLIAFNGKVTAIMSASPGGLGGLRGLVPLRMLLGNIGLVVLPQQVALGKAYEAFNEDGTLKDPKQQASIEKLGSAVTTFLLK